MTTKWTHEQQLDLEHFTERVKHLEAVKSEAISEAVVQAASSLRTILRQTCELLGNSWTSDEIDEVMQHIAFDLADNVGTDNISNLLTYIQAMKKVGLM